MLLKLVGEADRDVKHHVISLTTEGTLGPAIEAVGGQVTPLKLKGWREAATALPRISNLLQGLHPSLVQGWMYHGNVAASLATTLGRKSWPVAWSIRCTIGTFEERRLTKMLVRASALLSGQPRMILYNSQAAQQQHEAIGYAKHGKVLGNGFDLNRFAPDAETRNVMRARLGIIDQRPIIGYVGRLAPIKDLPTFFSAMARVARKYPDVAVVALGRDLPRAHELLPESRADLAFLGARLTLLPEQSDVREWYRAFDICVLTSLAEGFPNVIGEAMASGVPCVSTDVGTCRLVIGQTGRLVAPKDPAALGAAIANLLSYPAETLRVMGLAARARITEHFSIASITHAHEAEWRRLASSEV